MHPMQLHIRELATLIRKLRESDERLSLQPVEREWCDCQEIRQRVSSELGEPGGPSSTSAE
ncbi:MAG: hypothetical protein O2820_03280 [Planctomycetota bacterium]|nr:hypothetical protein [Planctomycetota bacterium]MDA1248224.1 hypothetical protein [Planctomycetota bacterium]